MNFLSTIKMTIRNLLARKGLQMLGQLLGPTDSVQTGGGGGAKLSVHPPQDSCCPPVVCQPNKLKFARRIWCRCPLWLSLSSGAQTTDPVSTRLLGQLASDR